MHVLDLENLLELSKELFRATPSKERKADDIRGAIEKLQGELADMVSEHLEIQHQFTEFDFQGLFSRFGPTEKGQQCPDVLKGYDNYSDWVRYPEEVCVAAPYIVLYRPAHATGGDPMVYRTKRTSEKEARQACAFRTIEPISILGVYQTASLQEALRAFRESRDANPEAVDSVTVAPADNEVVKVPFEISDRESTGSAAGVFTFLPIGVSARFTGYTDMDSADDAGELILLTRENGSLMLRVFASVNQSEPTHTISLEDARNERREILHHGATEGV